MAQLNTRILLRNDSSANWLTSKDQVLLKGEVGVEFLESGEPKMKIGDGVKTWEQLDYFGGVDATHYEGTRNGAETDQAVIERVLDGAECKKDDIFIVKSLISGDKYSYTAYVYNGTAWAAMDGNYNAENVYFDEDMMVTKEIGYITLSNGQGTIPSSGKNIKEVFEAMFVKEANPSTTQPSVSISMPQAGAYEVGTELIPSYTASFNIGKYTYGPATGVSVESWEISDTNSGSKTTNTGSFDSLVVADNTNYKITAKAHHTAGAVPVTNKNNPYNAGKIAAGTKQATSGAITGFRSFFYGVLPTSTAEAPLSSEIIRGLTNGGAYNGSKTFTINANATAKRIVVAIPAASTRNGVNSVILTSAMNTPITDSYVLTESGVQVEGKNGASAVAYDVYVYEPAAIDAGEVHKITLA